MTTTNNVNNVNNLSLEREILDEDKKILIDFAKENVKDKRKYKAYYNKLVENGDYKTILEDLRKKEEQKKKLEEQKALEKAEFQKIKSFKEFTDSELTEYISKNQKMIFKGQKLPPLILAEKEAKKRSLIL